MDMLEQFSEHESVKPSFHADIVGRCFYNHQKRAWFKVVEAVPLFTSFSYSFGVRWIDKTYHSVKRVAKCSKKEVARIEACPKSEFKDLSC